jgi:HK97 family phage prohead protease
MMIIRNKSGQYRIDNSSVLLDFLGVKTMNSEQGIMNDRKIISIEKDVVLIASVPFALAADGEAADSPPANPDGIAWTLSTFDLDRFSERIDPAGWDYKRYRDNPVVEWAHRYDIPAIGKADRLYTDDKGLHGLIIFNDKDYDPFGWAIGRRVRAGVIRSGSVGFRPVEIELPAKEEGKDGTTLIFRKQELLEFSICNVPANPFALAKSANAGRTETTQDFYRSGFWGGLINNFQGV